MFNSGVFDDVDWDGICSVCLSHKEDKSDKIGRYGQGFKSVFHLTGNRPFAIRVLVQPLWL